MKACPEKVQPLLIWESFVWHWCNLADKESGWNVHVWTMMISLYQSEGAVDTIEWACVLCSCDIQNDWGSRATNLHHFFAVSLNIPPWKLFGWFRRLQLWANGDWQLHHNNVPAHASHLMQSFLMKHQTTQVT